MRCRGRSFFRRVLPGRRKCVRGSQILQGRYYRGMLIRAGMAVPVPVIRRFDQHFGRTRLFFRIMESLGSNFLPPMLSASRSAMVAADTRSAAGTLAAVGHCVTVCLTIYEDSLPLSCDAPIEVQCQLWPVLSVTCGMLTPAS